MSSLFKSQFFSIIWGLVILVMCDIPMPESGESSFFEGFDKLVHTGFFFVLTVLLFRGSIIRNPLNRDARFRVVKVFAASALFGGLIEILQLKIFTYRSADWWDFFADVVGISMGLFSYLMLYRAKK